jgi:hypothetical protein
MARSIPSLAPGSGPGSVSRFSVEQANATFSTPLGKQTGGKDYGPKRLKIKTVDRLLRHLHVHAHISMMHVCTRELWRVCCPHTCILFEDPGPGAAAQTPDPAPTRYSRYACSCTAYAVCSTSPLGTPTAYLLYGVSMAHGVETIRPRDPPHNHKRKLVLWT